MSRVVTSTVVGPGSHRLAAAPREVLDPVVRERVEQVSAEAFDRGFQEGCEQGAAVAQDELAARLEQLGTRVVAALDAAATRARAADDETVEAAFELAVAMAGAILDAEPHDGGAGVAARIRDALETVEDPAPVVQVHDADLEAVTAALADVRSVTVEVGPGLGSGEARIRGGWADADLTRATAFAAIRRSLHVDG